MISVIIGFKARSVPILKFVCGEWLKYGADRVIVVNTGREQIGLKHPIYEICVPTISWHEGMAKNLGAIFAPSGIIVTTNADIVPRFDIKGDANGLIRGRYIGPTKQNYSLTEVQTIEVLKGLEPSGKMVVHQGGKQHKDAPGDGNPLCAEGDYLMIFKDDFMHARGYDSEDTGWGGCDTYFGKRLRASGIKQTHSDGILWHLWHEHPGRDSARNRAYYGRKEQEGFWQ